MGKVAFCFPGQGSLEEGMGREIAEAVPEAMEVYRRGSEATGMDLAALCFEAPLDTLVETEVQQPTLVATSLAILAALEAEGLRPDVVVGHSVGEFAALAAVRAIETDAAIGLVRQRGLVMAQVFGQAKGQVQEAAVDRSDFHPQPRPAVRRTGALRSAAGLRAGIAGHAVNWHVITFDLFFRAGREL